MSGVMISAAHKSSGKTVVSVGLIAALRARGLPVQAFKKGPDYIDPLWHRAASDRPCFNLDFQTQSGADIRALFAQRSADARFRIVEGNKGLHDGVELDGSNSNAALAKLLDIPVVLVVDTRGMTRGVAPLLLGFQQFDPGIAIGGVIFNQVGGARHEGKLVQVVEQYTDIPVLGAVHRNPALSIDERHLGLIPSTELDDSRRYISAAREAICQQVDVDRFAELASIEPTAASTARNIDPCDLRIAIAQDPAFGFYYADDLEAFARHGAELIPFNALDDNSLPDCDGLFIGGGFPEMRMRELEANSRLRRDIRTKLESGLPCYAECGGLMYLSQSIQWNDEQAEMVGAIAADSVMHARPQGRGYVRFEENDNMPWGKNPNGPSIQAHEFHHSSLEGLPTAPVFAYEVKRGKGISGKHDGIVVNNTLASYTHRRSTQTNDWVKRFVDFVRSKRRSQRPD